MRQTKSEKSLYYQVEINSKTATIVSAASELLAKLMVGKLENLEPILADAYEKRTGKKLEGNAIEQVRNALKLVQYIVWDSTYGESKNEHGCNPASDALFDVSEVLDYQLSLDKVINKEAQYPMHWNDEVPLCRIRKTYTSVYNRNKQLGIFPSDKK